MFPGLDLRHEPPERRRRIVARGLKDTLQFAGGIDGDTTTGEHAGAALQRLAADRRRAKLRQAALELAAVGSVGTHEVR